MTIVDTSPLDGDDLNAVVTTIEDDSYAVMLLTAYSDRIMDAMLGTNQEWKPFSTMCTDAEPVNVSCDVAADPTDVRDSKKRRIDSKLTATETTLSAVPSWETPSNVIVVPTSTTSLDGTERRKERNGFSLLIVPNANQSPAELSPLARQQISWAAKLSHFVRVGRTRTPTPTSEIEPEINTKVSSADSVNVNVTRDVLLNNTAGAVYQSLVDHQQFNIRTNEIRIDVFPKSLVSDFCRALQTHTAKHSPQHNNDGSTAVDTDQRQPQPTILTAEESTLIDFEDEFSGPLIFTKSASRASYVITVIQINETSCAFGISNREEHWKKLNERFNGYAAAQVYIESTDSTTGLDATKKTSGSTASVGNVDCIPITAPVSRAYYKLQQVYEECLQHHSTINSITASKPPSPYQNHSGMDLGASPGGWSQVLHTSLSLPNVLSIDPATLAKRVLELPGVVHVRGDMACDAAVEQMVALAPFSVVVSDASVDFQEVLTKIVEALGKANQQLLKAGTSNRVLLTTPSVIVITLKLPRKSKTSIDKNLKLALHALSKEVQTMMTWVGQASPVEKVATPQPEEPLVDFKILHLMANSACERTCVIRFRRTTITP